MRAVAAALLIAAATAQATTQAQAQATRPGMLAVTDLPPDSLTWQGGPSDEPGWNAEPHCLSDWNRNGLPEDGVWSAEFFTSETAAAFEKVIVLPTEAEAVAVAESARQYYAGCTARTQASYPGTVVTGQDHGTVDVEEGATVGGVHLRKVPAWEGYRNFLYGVGRDGNTVAIVEWESNWTQPDVPAFKETVRAAVNKLY
ncbi:hypothetical protein BU198_27575 [Streptomyces sp. CBMA156]|nr:hypothetical protein [Streptomyces sp. CBMA156]